MPDSQRVGVSPGVPEALHDNGTDVGWLEELLRGAREQLEENVVNWTAELTAAHATMLGACREGTLSGAVEHLDRLAEALHQAPELLEKQLLERLGAGRGKANKRQG